MIAEQAEHDAAAADAAAAEYEANEKKRPAPKTFTRSDDETPVEGVEEATSKCFRCGGIGHWARDCPKKAKTAPAGGRRAGRAADVPRQKGPEVRPHEAVDVAQREEPEPRLLQMPRLLLLQVGRRVVGQVLRRGVGPGRGGQEAPVGRELLQVRCCRSLGARTIPCLLILRGDGVAGASDLNNTRVPRRTAPPTTSPKRTSPRRRSSRPASARRAAAR